MGCFAAGDSGPCDGVVPQTVFQLPKSEFRRGCSPAEDREYLGGNRASFIGVCKFYDWTRAVTGTSTIADEEQVLIFKTYLLSPFLTCRVFFNPLPSPGIAHAQPKLLNSKICTLSRSELQGVAVHPYFPPQILIFGKWGLVKNEEFCPM